MLFDRSDKSDWSDWSDGGGRYAPGTRDKRYFVCNRFFATLGPLNS